MFASPDDLMATKKKVTSFIKSSNKYSSKDKFKTY